MLDNYIYSFNTFLRERYGERVHKLSLNAGWGCPNKDGRISRDGCIFCNEEGFTFFKTPSLSLKDQIEQAMESARKKFKAKKFIAYFQEGSSSSAPLDALTRALMLVTSYDSVVGIFLSSRPDGINKKIVSLLNKFCSEYLVCVELGMQTAQEESLHWLNRNHTIEDVRAAVKCIRDYSSAMVSAHLILGIPQEEKDAYTRTLDEFNRLEFNGAKFHAFHILKNTRAETLYKEKKIRLMTSAQYVDTLRFMLERVASSVYVERIISTAATQYLIAPNWMNDRTKIQQSLENSFKRHKTKQGIYHDRPHTKS